MYNNILLWGVVPPIIVNVFVYAFAFLGINVIRLFPRYNISFWQSFKVAWHTMISSDLWLLSILFHLFRLVAFIIFIPALTLMYIVGVIVALDEGWMTDVVQSVLLLLGNRESRQQNRELKKKLDAVGGINSRALNMNKKKLKPVKNLYKEKVEEYNHLILLLRVLDQAVEQYANSGVNKGDFVNYVKNQIDAHGIDLSQAANSSAEIQRFSEKINEALSLDK